VLPMSNGQLICDWGTIDSALEMAANVVQGGVLPHPNLIKTAAKTKAVLTMIPTCMVLACPERLEVTMLLFFAAPGKSMRRTRSVIAMSVSQICK